MTRYRTGPCACGRAAVYELPDDRLLCQACYRAEQAERQAGVKGGTREERR